MTSTSAAAFAAHEAIRSGEWDEFLPGLNEVLKERMRMLAPPKVTPEMEASGQVWVWIKGWGSPGGWEIRGTGVTGL